jgi:imidazolonepropionase-like amidohydrolase
MERGSVCRVGAVRWLCGVIVLAGGVARADFESFTTPLAIEHVRLFSQPGVEIGDATVLIDQGMILAIGNQVDFPAHTERFDGTGLYAYSGFIDAFTNLGVPDRPRDEAQRQRAEDENPDPREGPYAATRGANRRGILPEFRVLDAYQPDEGALTKHRRGGFCVAVAAPRSAILSGTGAVVSLGAAPIRRSIVLPDFGMHAGFRTNEAGAYPRSLLGIIASLRQTLYDAQWYADLHEFVEGHPFEGPRPAFDEALAALQPVLRGERRLFFAAETERQIHRALGLADEFGVEVGIVGGDEAYKVVDLLKTRRVPLIIRLKFDEEPEYGKKKDDEKRKRKEESAESEKDPVRGEEKEQSPDEKKDEAKKDKPIYEPLKVRKERRRLWEEQVTNVIRLQEAGIPFALTTDGVKDVEEFHKNLRKVMERGLSSSAVLAALTTTPAEFLGLSDRLGVATPRHAGNLVLFDKPLEDKDARVRYVFVDGRKFEFKKDDDKKDDKGKGKKDSGEGKKPGGESPDEEPPLFAAAASPAAEPREPPRGAARAQPDPQSPPGEAEADEPAEQAENQPSEQSAEPKASGEAAGPEFAAEIKADRVPRTRTGGNVLIRGGVVLPVTSDPIANGFVLVRDGRIAAIGEVGPELTAPDGVTVIDATDRFVLPGFVDGHSHLGTEGTNEGTLPITAEVRILDTLNQDRVGVYRAVAGGTTTHHVMHGSANPIGGQCAIVKMKYGQPLEEALFAGAPPTIKFALGENVTQANFEGATGKRYPNTRMGVEAVIREALETARQYAAQRDEAARRAAAGEAVRPLRRDLRLDALAGVLSGDITVHAHCYRSDEILRLLHVAEEYGFRIGTLHHVLEGYRIAPEIARHGAGTSTFANSWAYKIEAYGAIPHNAAMLLRHGVSASINSDSPNTIRYLGQEAAKSIRWGALTAEETLRLVTIEPARQLQIDDRVGSLEVGKDGDVAIFNGHPLNSFSRCVMTLIDGEVFFEDDDPTPAVPFERINSVPAPWDRPLIVPPGERPRFALVGGTVHTIRGPVIENGTVLMIDGIVHDVGADVRIPGGTSVVDVHGLHVYPGMIDAGSRIGLSEVGSLRSTRDYAEIGTTNPQLTAISAVHAHSAHVRVARSAGITTTLVAPVGGRIAGQSTLVHLDGWTADEMVILDRVGLHMTVPSLPPNLPEERRKQREEEHDKAVDALEEYMLKAKHYAEVRAAVDKDPSVPFQPDVEFEAMVPYVRGEKPVMFSAGTYKHILDTIEFAEKHKLRCVIHGGDEAWKLADTLAEKKIPVILGTAIDLPSGEFEPWDSVYACAAALDRAGVAFCFASEEAMEAFNLGPIVGMAVAHGLPVERAEYAVTAGAADILGVGDRLGSIEIGRVADVIVTNDSPLQAGAVVTHMFISGRPVDLSTMQTESYERFRNRPAPTLPPPAAALDGPPNLTTP